MSNLDVLKFQMPLSAKTTVVILIDGVPPGRTEFERFRDIVDVLEVALSGEATEVASEPVRLTLTPIPEIREGRDALDLPVEKPKRKLKVLGPCTKHPTAARHPYTNRCVDCLSDHARKMGLARRGATRLEAAPETPAAVAPAPSTEDPEPGITPPVRTGPVGIVWSRPVRCPKCGAGMVRLHRSTRADRAKDYWVHDRAKPETACLIKISLYKVAEDPDYQGSALER